MSELSNSPLRVVTFENESRRRNRGIPLMMEFQVNPDLAPFLVSSSKATLWVNGRSGTVRAAVRDEGDLSTYFREVVTALIEMGRERDWGSVHPLTSDGIRKAIEHVKSYDLNELEILVNPQIDWSRIDPQWKVGSEEIPMILFGLNIQPAPWMDLDTVVIVPKDRDYVGFILLFEGRIVSVVHNGARGVGVATAAPQIIAAE